MTVNRKTPTILSDSLYLIGSIAIFVTVLLGVFSFALSYMAMRELARASEAVVSGLDILWPLVVDFAMIVFGTVALFKTLKQQSSWRQRALVVLFSGLSILFNVLHSPNRWQSQLVAAMPPFALVLALESLIGMISSSFEKHKVDGRDRVIDEQSRQLDELEKKLSELTPIAVMPTTTPACFCGYSGDDLDSHNGLHVYQVRQVRTPNQGLEVLKRLYSGNGNMPNLETISAWQAASK